MSIIYKFYNKRIGIYTLSEKQKNYIRYYESSQILDSKGIIEKYSLEDKNGKEIQNILGLNEIQFEKLLQLSIIYHDWFLYRIDKIPNNWNDY